MFTAPLASLNGWNWTQVAVSDLPVALRPVFPPATDHPAVNGVGPVTVLRFPARGRWRHAQTSGSDVHWIWGSAADVLAYGAIRTRLPFGNPLVALRFRDPVNATTDSGDKKGAGLGEAVMLNGNLINVAQLTILASVPGKPGLDTLGVLRYLGNALAAEAISTAAPTFTALILALARLEQPLRILEPGGSPAAGRSIRVTGSTPVVLGPSGDALAALGLTRAGLAGVTLDVGHGEQVVVSASGASFPDGRVPLSAASDTVTIATLNEWLAPQQSAALQRFTRGNTVRPFVDGVDHFADLFVELNKAVDAGPQGAFYVTGYSLQHDANLVPAGGQRRTVEEVATAMAAAGGDARFLALQMLQLNPGWVRDVQTAGALTAMLLSLGGAVATAFQDNPDQATFFAHTQLVAAALFLATANLDSLIDGFEINRDSIAALDALDGVEAHLDPVDAETADNPVAQPGTRLVDLVLAATRRWTVFHQKIQVVRNAERIRAYCGGIDLHTNRMQDFTHASRNPFHDVHASVDGQAAGELAKTFIERWRAVSPTSLALDVAGALTGLPTAGPDVVQVARTYFRPAPGSGRGHPTFAPNGESTILETLIRAIGRARRYIYLEDQYLTPPPRLRDALAAAAAQVSGPLIIVIPSSPDQPFGLPRRRQFIADMRAAWGDRCKVGYLRKKFSHSPTTTNTAHGRLWLASDLEEIDDIVVLRPADRVPPTPFWLTVGEEVMRAYQTVAGAPNPATSRLHVERSEASRLFTGTTGTARRRHQRDAAVNAGSFPAIYVHSKIMLIDDVFASIGSANCNRRGYYSDGECNIFGLRENLADGTDNWIRNLRIDLWAEHLGLSPEYARVALLDAVAGLALFDRKLTVGNRFSLFEAQPYTTEVSLATEVTNSTSVLSGVVAAATVIAGVATAIAGTQADAVFDTIIDPTSFLETL